MLDVEALIAFTLVVALDQPEAERGEPQPAPPQVDARLLDGMLDWLCRNGQLISLQRLRNIRKEHRFGWSVPLEASIAWVARHSSLRWKPSQPIADGPYRPTAERLTSHSSDPTFAEYGIVVAPPHRNRLPAEPQLAGPTAAALRLRHLVGVGAHSEVIRILALAGHDAQEMFLSDISLQAGYAKRNVRAILDGMEASGFVVSRLRGRERCYRLLNARRWAELFDLGSPRGLTNWIGLFRLAISLRSWLDMDADSTTYIRRSHARDYYVTEFQDVVRRRVVDLGLVNDLPLPDRAEGTPEFLRQVTTNVLAALHGEPRI